MNDDDLRGRLAGLANRAPDAAPGTGARVRRAVRRRFHATVATVGCLALLVGVAGAIAVTRDRGAAGLVAADPTTTPPAESPPPSPESPTPSATASPTPTPTPTPTPSETPEPTPPPADHQWPTAVPAASPVPGADPYDDAPVSATGSGEEGLRVTITLAPGGPRTATAVTLDVHIEDDDGAVRLSSVDWGDGTSQDFPWPHAMCAIDVPEWKPHADDAHVTLRHSWRAAGTFHVEVQVASDVQCVQHPPRAETATAGLDAVIEDGPAVTNGPWLPYVESADVQTEADHRLAVWLSLSLWDPDGWVGPITVDWGDGSKPQVVEAYDEGTCDDGDGAHFPFAPGNSYRGERHVYPRAGTYHVVVTFVSAGCDGSDEQRGTISGPATPG